VAVTQNYVQALKYDYWPLPSFIKPHKDCPVTLFYDAPPLSAPAIPAGYKLVPVEPSLKMMEAAVTCEDASFDTESDMVCIHHEVIYKAMLAAAAAAAPAPEEL